MFVKECLDLGIDRLLSTFTRLHGLTDGAHAGRGLEDQVVLVHRDQRQTQLQELGLWNNETVSVIKQLV